MSLGCNDPCPCGSGRKYKKCCLAKGKEAKRATQTKTAAPADPAPHTSRQGDVPKPPADPRIEAFNTRWSEFKAADYEGKLDLFAFLELRGLIDAEMRAEALSGLEGLADNLRRAFDNFDGDPAPRQACAGWREKARKTLSE